MFSFTVLKYDEIILARLGYFSKQMPSPTTQNKFFKRLSSYYILLTTTIFVLTSAIFVLQNLSQFDIALRSSAIAIGTAQSIGMYFSFGTNVRKIHAIHFKLQKIIDERTSGNIFNKYSNISF